MSCFYGLTKTPSDQMPDSFRKDPINPIDLKWFKLQLWIIFRIIPYSFGGGEYYPETRKTNFSCLQ